MRGFSNQRKMESETLAQVESSTNKISINNGVITIHLSRRSDEVKLCKIDMNNFWLPATAWAPNGTRLPEREELTDLIVGALKIYLRRTGESKSTETVVRNITNALCKLFEYGWLNRCYSASDWSPAHAKSLLSKLSTGGWQSALSVHERAMQWTQNASLKELSTLSNKQGGLREKRLRKNLLTNAQGRELQPAFMLITNALPTTQLRERAYKSSSSNGMSTSLLRQTMGWINLLTDVPKIGLAFVPYENIFKLSRENGRALGSTKNISPGEVGTVLKEAFKWIYTFSIPILALFQELTEELVKQKTGTRNRHRIITELLNSSKHRSAVEDALGVTLGLRSSFRSDGTTISISTIAQAMFDACFVTLGFLNARRADEIQGRSVGIYYDALTLFDDRLGLYECEFYLEKYRKGYKRFFVNSASVAAIKLLQVTSDLAVQLRISAELSPIGNGNSKTERKISQAPQFIFNAGKFGPKWFSFDSTEYGGGSRYFLKAAFKENTNWQFRPHMLRRAYALIYYYRYEEGELLALAQQLDHFSVETTGIYLSEGSVKDGRVSLAAFSRVSEEEKALLAMETRSIESEMEVVHHEKMHAFVDSVIQGMDNTSGGLAKLFRRIYAKLATRLDYSGLDYGEQVKVVVSAILNRGHRLHPYRHGDCGAPEIREGKGLARCRDEQKHTLDRSRASPELCHKCPYHRSTSGHLEGLKKEKLWMQGNLENLPKHSLLRRRQEFEIASLEKVISFHAEVMG